MSNNRMMIWPVMEAEADEPKKGLFEVTLHKGAEPRALCVDYTTDGLWLVHLDGKSVTSPNARWHLAFGWIFSRSISNDASPADMMPMLIGEQIGFEKYQLLVRLRKRDEQDGFDLSKPIIPQKISEQDIHHEKENFDFLTVPIP